MNTKPEDLPANEGDSKKEKPDTVIQGLVGPVPPEKHQEVFKDVEKRVRRNLAKSGHPYVLTGLRVAYDLQDSSNEPFDMPFLIEFGDLSELDQFIKNSKPQQLTIKELVELSKDAPIGYYFLKDLHKDGRLELAISTKEEITVGVFISVTGSPSEGYAMACCKGGKKKLTVTTNRRGEQVNSCGQKCPTPVL